MNFTQIMETCNKIKSISSTNEKKEFLASITDEDFKNFLKWEFDSSIISGISDKKINKVLADDMFDDGDWSTCDVKSIFDVFRYLENHKTGKDEDIRIVQWYRNQICKNDEEVEFFNNMIIKNVIIGCDVKLINSVWEGLIPTFDVMLANSYFKLNESQWNKISKNGTRSFNILCKYDGFRCIAIKENGICRLVSRHGKIYENCVDIEKAINELPYDNFVLDSEIIISNRNRYPSTEQYKYTTNIVNLKNEDKHGLTLNCFDYISLKEWNSKNGVTPWTERRKKLEEVLKDYSDTDDKPLYLAPILYNGNNLDMALSLLTKARENNEEGVMLRFDSSKYEFKRSNELLKFKVMSDMDVYIDSYDEGENKLKGSLGAFYCHIDHPKYGYLEMKVGGGMTDSERYDYWQHRDELIGRVMEVQYFEVTKNAKGGNSIRFPVHKCIKPIGTEPNN